MAWWTQTNFQHLHAPHGLDTSFTPVEPRDLVSDHKRLRECFERTESQIDGADAVTLQSMRSILWNCAVSARSNLHAAPSEGSRARTEAEEHGTTLAADARCLMASFAGVLNNQQARIVVIALRKWQCAYFIVLYMRCLLRLVEKREVVSAFSAPARF